MEPLAIWKAIILGIIEGLTEFLPVSSTGHLIIFGDLLNFTGDRAKSFEIVIQLGAILAVAWAYRAKIINVATTLNQTASQKFVINLGIAFLPAAVIGVLFSKAIKAHLFNPITVAIALIVGGIIILIVERVQRTPRITSVEQMSRLDAFKVGCAQCFALFPGTSRSGATIVGGLLTGLSRTAAAEFSFFLAIPTMFAATVYEVIKHRALFHREDLPLFAAGFVAAFIVAMFVVRLFIAYIGKHNFTVFAVYRIIFGGVVLWYFTQVAT